MQHSILLFPFAFIDQPNISGAPFALDAHDRVIDIIRGGFPHMINNEQRNMLVIGKGL